MNFNEMIDKKKEALKEIKKIKCTRNKKFYKLKNFIIDRPFIAEIKKSSPTIGNINKEVDVIRQAIKYEEYGAGAISVLTEELFFSGDFEDLYEISRKVKLPVLCKDFIMDKMQILNAHISGADIVLIMVYILDDEKIKELVDYAQSMDLEVLFEIVDLNDYERIKNFNPEYILVNSRNFKTMEIEFERAKEVLKNLKGDFIKIAASGIKKAEDIIELKKAGADAFLIGTTLMRSKNLKNTFEELYKCL